jgi:hypothetical protein
MANALVIIKIASSNCHKLILAPKSPPSQSLEHTKKDKKKHSYYLQNLQQNYLNHFLSLTPSLALSFNQKPRNKFVRFFSLSFLFFKP